MTIPYGFSRPCVGCGGSGQIPSPTGHGSAVICGRCRGSGRVELSVLEVDRALRQAKEAIERAITMLGDRGT